MEASSFKKKTKKRNSRLSSEVQGEQPSTQAVGAVEKEERHENNQKHKNSCDLSCGGDNVDRDGERMGGGAGGEGEEAPTSKKLKAGKIKRSGIMTNEPFSSLPITESTKEAVREMGFVNMTQVKNNPPCFF